MTIGSIKMTVLRTLSVTLTMVWKFVGAEKKYIENMKFNHMRKADRKKY